jgi:hypothetical protein
MNVSWKKIGLIILSKSLIIFGIQKKLSDIDHG